MKKVIDLNTKKAYIVDDTHATLYSYCNKKRQIIRNAAVYENGVRTDFHINYEEIGTVDDLEEKLHTWNNVLWYAYARSVSFDQEHNDPDRIIYRKFLDNLRANEDKYFDSYGDFLDNGALNSQALIDAGVFVEDVNAGVIHEVAAVPLLEYCKKTGMSRSTALRKLKRGEIDGEKYGGQWFIPENTEGLYIMKFPFPQGYISLEAYCRRHGNPVTGKPLDIRNVRRKLAAGGMTGIKYYGVWFLPADEPYYNTKR